MSSFAPNAILRPEEEFQLYVLENLDLAESLMDGYRFRKLRSMIDDVGAVETVKRLLDPSRLAQPYDGFSALGEYKLLHLSLEQAVVTFDKRGLFHGSLVSAAKARLKIANRKRG